MASDAKALRRCAESGLKCVQTKTGAAREDCLASARAKCAASVASARRTAADKLGAAIARKCGSARLAPEALLGQAGLGFMLLEPTCDGAFGIGADSLPGVTECLERSLACRSESAIALAMPRAADFLADAGIGDGSCLPAPTGDLSGWPDTERGAKGVKCQLAIGKATGALAKSALQANERCLASVLKCQLLSATPESCLEKAAPRCRAARDRVAEGLASVVARQRIVIAKACGGLPLTELTTVPGLGFELAEGRCVELGVPALDDPEQISACVLRDQRCEAADVARLATPRIDEILAAVGESPAPDDFTCPDFSPVTPD